MDERNSKITSANELFELLNSISKYLERKIKFYALGGTALTILGIKQSTLDVDIDICSKKDYEYLCSIFEKIGFKRLGTIRWQTQEGLFFDLFEGSNILGTALLSDFVSKSKFIRSFDNIELYTMSLDDIIISKLARGDPRDFDDIRRIFETQKIDLKELVKRYEDTMETSVVALYKQKLLDLIEIEFNNWGFTLDMKLIDEVKKWE
ncbi:MAG: nucleotidyltransferase [Candidatus Woesearchaeota archaeon]